MSKAAKIALGVLALLLIALPWLLGPYQLQIAILTVTYSMLGLAFAFSLRVGLPRLDIAGWWGVGAYATALLMQRADMSFWFAMLVAGIIAVILGWLIFIIALPRGMIVFLLFGMVLAMAFYQLFGSLEFFGGWGGTGIVPQPTIGSFTFANKPELYYLGLFFLAVNLLVYYLLYNSKIGRAWNAIGSSLKLASSVGVNVVRYRMANVLIGNFFIAIAGSYYVAYSLVAVPSAFGFNFSVYILIYAVIGGFLHSLAGPILGAAIVTYASEYLRVVQEYEPIVTAGTVILIIIFMPMGILGLIDQRVKPWLARRKLYALFSGGGK